MKIEKITNNFNERKSVVEHKMKNGKTMLFNFGNGDGKRMPKAVKVITDPKHELPPIVIPYNNVVNENDKTYGVYAYVNNETGVVAYIGMDKHIECGKRNYDHYLPSNFGDQKINMELQRNPGKYTYMVLETGLSKTECVIREIELIDEFGTYHNRIGHGKSYGYNMIRTAADIERDFSWVQTLDLRTGRVTKTRPYASRNRVNDTGYFRVSKHLDGYRYQWWDEQGHRRGRTAKTIPELKSIIESLDLEWRKL